MPSDSLRQSPRGSDATLPPGWTASPSPSRAHRLLLPGLVCPPSPTQVCTASCHHLDPYEAGVEAQARSALPTRQTHLTKAALKAN